MWNAHDHEKGRSKAHNSTASFDFELHDESYSRNPLYGLNLISRFLLYLNVINF